VSVFQDGVRINEAFGDVVNWDLLAPKAISSIQLIPGSVPAFGLNTLGGALAIYTKSGAQYPGANVEVSGGSFGRVEVQAEAGGAHGDVDAYATGRYLNDRGWADHNPSRLAQFFGKVGYQDASTDVDVSVTLADNTLQGAQTLPLSMLGNPKQAYTYPDINENRVAFVAAKGSRFVDPTLLIGGNAYVRQYRNSNVSSNVNDGYGTPGDDGPLQVNEAFIDRSTVDQRSWGAGLQITKTLDTGTVAHQLVAGVTGDFGRTRYTLDAQTADFTADRGTVATGPYVTDTDVDLANDYYGVYVADTITLAPQWTLTLAGRFNRAKISIADRTGDDPALDGTHTFSRFSPAIGINWNPVPTLTAYAGYNEGMRAPTPIELTCADPTAPCKLPNQFLADPPLDMVVSKTFETGARGKWGSTTSWSAALYRTDLDNDIQFIASGSGATNAGYFQNVGRTRRQGIELAATTYVGPWSFVARYSYLDATFRSSFAAASPNNSSADASGAIVVQPGDRIPAVPRDSLKLRAEYAPVERFALGVDGVYASSQYALGDENNEDRNGRLPSYVVFNLNARYDITPALQIFANVSNLFDRRYQTVALLGANAFTGPGNSFGPSQGIAAEAEQFRASAAPRGAWIGIRYAFDVRPTAASAEPAPR
jgi:outer membrane receptor protein involved in Fe transport